MFWGSPEALERLLDPALGADEFGPEAGRVDGTTAHAAERLVGLSARRAGLSNEASADTLEDDLTSYRSRPCRDATVTPTTKT
jgi:lipopolysaccharide biosynthesis protein